MPLRRSPRLAAGLGQCQAGPHRRNINTHIAPPHFGHRLLPLEARVPRVLAGGDSAHRLRICVTSLGELAVGIVAR
jgi:hypothetical protein